MDEFNLIDKYFQPLTNNIKESQKLQDDVAIIKDNNLVISKDIIVEDVHFYKEDGAYNIANRLIRSNLSDIAASGSKPLYYMLGFCKNHHVDEAFLANFSKALKEINQEFNISLIGGDTIKSKDKLFFSITIFGEINKNILSRKNAADKDLIFVSGNIGDAYLGRKILENQINSIPQNKEYLISKYYKPSPRIKLGQELIKQKLSKCAIDISDGLFLDLKHICKSSNMKATIFKNKIPFSKEANNILKNNKNITIMELCSAGDDYELIFSVNEANSKKIAILSKTLGINLTNIGYLEKNHQTDQLVTLIDNKCEIKIDKLGYEH